MNAPVDVLTRDSGADVRLGIIDCDIHPYPKAGALNQYLSERWRKHVAEYGKFNCGPYADRGTYPRFSPNTSRRDSWPPNGGPAGFGCRFHPQRNCSTPTTSPTACWSRCLAATRRATSMRLRRCVPR